MKRNVERGAGMPRYLRARSVATMLDCHVGTVWRLAKAGRLPAPHRLGPGLTAWRLDELEAALERATAGEPNHGPVAA